MVTGLTILGGTVSAFAAANTSAPLTVTPSTGLSNGTMVAVSGTGYTPNSIGNLIECNNDPNIPQVMLGAPVNNKLGVGCTPVSLTQLVQTDASGNIKAGTTFKVAGGTIGPPCGPAPAAVTCPPTDSAGVAPAADAANYPCPPTPAQQTAGVTCVLNYGDAAGDQAVAVTLTFAGTATPTSAPPTTAAPTATTKPPAAPATTVAPATGASGGTTVTAAPAPVASNQTTLASTGPGPAVGWLGAVGGVLLLLGLLLLLVLLDVPQRAWAGFVDREGGVTRLRKPVDPGPDRSAPRPMAGTASSLTGHVNHAGHRLGDGLARVPGAARGVTHRVASVSTRTAAWLLGR